jgi:hypothetical protein
MPALAFEVIRSSGAFPPSWPRHAYRQSPPGFALRIVRRPHCDPSRNALRNPSTTAKSTSNGPVNRRLVVYGDRKLTLARSPIPMFDRKDHPSVPTCCPWRKAAGGGQGGPQAIAKRREASLRATHRLATLWQGGRSVTLPLPRDPYRRREAHGGSPSIIAAPTRQPSGSCSTWHGPKTRRLQHD